MPRNIILLGERSTGKTVVARNRSKSKLNERHRTVCVHVFLRFALTARGCAFIACGTLFFFQLLNSHVPDQSPLEVCITDCSGAGPASCTMSTKTTFAFH